MKPSNHWKHSHTNIAFARNFQPVDLHKFIKIETVDHGSLAKELHKVRERTIGAYVTRLIDTDVVVALAKRDNVSPRYYAEVTMLYTIRHGRAYAFIEAWAPARGKGYSTDEKILVSTEHYNQNSMVRPFRPLTFLYGSVCVDGGCIVHGAPVGNDITSACNPIDSVAWPYSEIDARFGGITSGPNPSMMAALGNNIESLKDQWSPINELSPQIGEFVHPGNPPIPQQFRMFNPVPPAQIYNPIPGTPPGDQFGMGFGQPGNERRIQHGNGVGQFWPLGQNPHQSRLHSKDIMIEQCMHYDISMPVDVVTDSPHIAAFALIRFLGYVHPATLHGLKEYIDKVLAIASRKVTFTIQAMPVKTPEEIGNSWLFTHAKLTVKAVEANLQVGQDAHEWPVFTTLMK